MTENISYNSNKMVTISYDQNRLVNITFPENEHEKLRQGLPLGSNLPASNFYGWAMTTNKDGFKTYRIPGSEDYQYFSLSFDGGQDIALTIDGLCNKKHFNHVKTVHFQKDMIKVSSGARTVPLVRNSAASDSIQGSGITAPANPAPIPRVIPASDSAPIIQTPPAAQASTHPAAAQANSSPAPDPIIRIPSSRRAGAPAFSAPAAANQPSMSGPTILTPSSQRSTIPTAPSLSQRPSPASHPSPLRSPATPAPANQPVSAASHTVQQPDEELRTRIRQLENENRDAQRKNAELQSRLDDALLRRDQARARDELIDLNQPEISAQIDEYHSRLSTLRSCASLCNAESVEGLLDQAEQIVNRAQEQLRVLIEQRERRAAQINDAINTGSGLVEKEV